MIGLGPRLTICKFSNRHGWDAMVLHGISFYRRIFKRLSIMGIFRIGVLICNIFYLEPCKF